MLARFARLIVFFAAVQILGGHWLALQSAAWIGMLAKYAQAEESVVTAIEKTFDGNHPCGLCKVVKSGRDEEQKQQVAKTMVKLDAVLGKGARLPWPRVEKWQYLDSVSEAAVRTFVPPTPPPQVA